MKQKTKIYSAVLAMALSLAAVGPVFAAAPGANSPSSDRSNVPSQRVIDARKNAVKDLMAAHITRLSVVTQRLASILKRIESRRDKMAAAGISVASLDPAIAQAEKQLADAEQTAAEAKTKLDAVDSAKDFKTAALEFVDVTTDLRSELRAAQNTLKSVVKAMLQLDAKSRSTAQGGENEDK